MTEAWRQCLTCLLLVGTLSFAAESERNRPFSDARRNGPSLTPKSVDREKVAEYATPQPVSVANGTAITAVQVIGDPQDLAAFRLFQLPDDTLLADYLQTSLINQRHNTNSLSAFAKAITTQEIVRRKYFLGYLALASFQNGKAVFYVSLGRTGRLAIQRTGHSTYFSDTQLLKRLAFKEDSIFRYKPLHKALFRLNQHPDLRLDAKLKARRADESLHQTGDLYLATTESKPWDLRLRAGNDGSSTIGSSRYSATFEHRNLTKRFDTLTLSYQQAEDVNNLATGYVAYDTPLDRAGDWSLRIFGGGGRSRFNDTLPGLDISGLDAFAGIQTSYRWIDTQEHLLSFSLGLSWRERKDLLFDTAHFPGSPLRSTPLDVSVSWATRQLDRLQGTWGGRGGLIIHRDWLSAASSKRQFALSATRRDYHLFEGSLWRFQRLPRHWSIVSRLSWQISPYRLPAAERFSAGGTYTVRGFQEDVAIGDKGASGTIELNSPWWHPRISQRIRAKAIGFIDAGTATNHNGGSTEIASAGIGISMALNRHARLRVHHGWQLASESNIPGSARTHLSLEITIP